MINQKKKIVVAISGGVDSAVAAFLLKNQGYEVLGVFMRLGDFGRLSEDAARRVCEKLEIKFYPINLSDKFNVEVVDYFLDYYRKGLTPNPCVKCNKFIKFGELLRIMKEFDADYLATGHYVSLLGTHNSQQQIRVMRSSDANKDQTYFLYNLKQDQLDHILFPLGSFKKDEVGRIAFENNIPVLTGESQDICFLNETGKAIEHNLFLQKNLRLTTGDIVWLKNENGVRNEKLVGQHKGLPLYTIGQRKGVEVGGIGPFYVSGMDYQKNILYVVDSVDDELLFRSEFDICDVNWTSGIKPKLPFQCGVMIRYRHKQVRCAIVSETDDVYHIALQKKERAIMPGQSAVFYDGDELLGGGVII
jgi:tRNA-specific 2-thiouridylase